MLLKNKKYIKFTNQKLIPFIIKCIEQNMIKFKSIFIILVIIPLIVSSITYSQDPLIPFRTGKAPVIDGRLDDMVWKRAPSVTGFKTWTPDYGIDMAEKTIVYLAYDSENMYFAFRCFDSHPDKIKTSITSRDNIRADDWVCINLDSFYDQQSLYAFYINPLGIQADSRYTGGHEDQSIDFVWYSKGRIDSKGYTIEIKIPFKSIRFANKNPVKMGVIFERRISRRSEQGTYPPLSPEQADAWLVQTKPMIFYNVKQYKLFELLPAFTTSEKSTQNLGKLISEGRKRDISLTTKYGITSDLTLDATYNPDFSQVEADAGQVDVNLRYDLFFPEKRPFFLEGRENFKIAGISMGDPIQSIVHTRMIVNPLLGIKLSGKIGNKNTVASINAVDELYNNKNEKYAYFSIFRFKRALTKDSYIGGIYTGRDLKNSYNRVAGIDGRLRINKSSIFRYHSIVSLNKENENAPKAGGHALSLKYVYNTRRFFINLGIIDISSKFHTESGYITRTGISRATASFSPKFYPESKVIKRVTPSIFIAQTKDKLSNLYEYFNTLLLRLTIIRSSDITLSYSHSSEIFLSKKFNTSGLRISGNSQFTKKIFFEEGPFNFERVG